MHKIILMMLLSVMSSSAMAGWVLFREEAPITFYVDWAGLKKSKNIVTVNILEDYKDPSTYMGLFVYNSATTLLRFDCKNFKTQLLDRSFYAENMGVNRVNGIEVSNDWRDEEDNLFLDVAKKVCPKK